MADMGTLAGRERSLQLAGNWLRAQLRPDGGAWRLTAGRRSRLTERTRAGDRHHTCVPLRELGDQRRAVRRRGRMGAETSSSRRVNMKLIRTCQLSK